MTAEPAPRRPEKDTATDPITPLVFAHYASVLDYLHHKVEEWELAQDLTQDTFLELYITRHRLAHVTSPRAWLFRIADHLGRNAVKRLRRIRFVPWHLVDREVSVHWYGVEEQVSRRALLRRALEALPPDYASALLLQRVYGLSVAEAAEALQVSQGAMRMRLLRARTRLQEVIAREERDA